MTIRGFKNHPYIPNSVEERQKEMLEELGLKDLSELHAEIPEELKLKENMDMPKACRSEYELKREIGSIMRKNITCEENLNFLGAGCWQHYVPAICDEINGRSEFLTGYAGEAYNDHGRFQALFEYESLVAELVDMDVVNVPTFDWSQAAATSIRMAGRKTKKKKALLASTLSKEKKMIIENYCGHVLDIDYIDYDKATGKMDLKDLETKLDDDVACVYFENPSYLGFIEDQGSEISELAKAKGAELVVGVDPSSLGVMCPPTEYGATIVCGELQPLGIHMNYGGGQSGFISTKDKKEYVMEFPSRLFGIAPTKVEGEYGFGDIAYDRTSFGDLREDANEFVGTQTSLWAITAGVYLSLMGPTGMFELGQNIMQNSQYAIGELNEIKGVRGSRFETTNFKEFVVDFNDTGLTVKEINEKLLERGIFGGKDLSCEFPELGQTALFCVTEIHLKEDIDQLVSEIRSIVEG